MGRQEKYKESNEIFIKLIAIDPKNERYENWYLTNIGWLLRNKFNIIEYLILAAFLVTIIFGDKLFEENILLVRIIVFVLFIGFFIFKRTYRKLIKIPNTEITRQTPSA